MVTPLPTKEKTRELEEKIRELEEKLERLKGFKKYLDDYIGELETVPALNDRHRGSLFCRLETLGLVKAAFNSFVKEIDA